MSDTGQSLKNIVDQVRELLRQDVVGRIGPEPSGEVAAMNLSDVLTVYLNWCGRLVAAQPRQVLISEELLQSTAYTTHQTAIQAIEAKIAAGDDLTPHLSRRITTRYVPTADRNGRNQGRTDLDLLISEWGLHHLHLSTEIENDGFVKRTGDLLFACFRPTQAFLIAVLEHNDWTNDDLVAISVRNWQGANLFTPVMGAIGLAQPIAAADRRILRNSGVTTLLEVDGKVYLAPGQTTAGTPLAVARQVMVILAELRRLEDEDFLVEALRASGGEIHPDGPRWEAFCTDGHFGIREAHSGWSIQPIRVVS